MEKKAVNLYVDKDLIKKAKYHGMNLSKFLENKLNEFITFIEGKPINGLGNSMPKGHSDNVSSSGLWSSGYDVAFTRRRSPVQIRISPLIPTI